MNYWNIDTNDLPSRGKEYPAGAYFRLRPLTVGNCKYLSTMNPTNPAAITNMLNEILRSCMETNVDFDKIVWADRDYMLYWIRVNSFVTSNGYELSIVCPHCGGHVSRTMRLDDLNIKYYEQSKFLSAIVFLGGSNVTVCANIPILAERKYLSDDPITESILNYTNIREFIPDDCDPTWYVSQMDAMDFGTLKNVAEKAKFGIESIITMDCSSCSKPIRVDIDLRDSNMFGRISLYEILKIQLQVSKYCGFQITDDTSYTEVELIQEAVKEFVEEEKAELEKQQGKTSQFTKSSFRMPNLK